MIIGKKFWKIDAAGSYSPGSQPGIAFGGTLTGTSITGVSSAIVTAIAALTPGTNPVGITGKYIAPGTLITAAVGTTLTISQASVAGPISIDNLLYWDATKPASAGGDQAIQAVLCLDSAHGAFTFVDSGGRSVAIPASTLVKGAIYYFQIGTVSTVTAGDFIGYAAN